MTGTNYSSEYRKEHMARGMGRSLPISSKKSIEICKYVRNKTVEKAKNMLEEVITMKKAVPHTRFNKDTGHKKGIGPGRYPIKACTEILKLIKSVEANAQFKGLNTKNLVITTICANRAEGQWHFGRQRRQRMKRTHIEVVMEEKAIKKKQKKTTKEKTEKTEVKKETNPEVKETPKTETQKKVKEAPKSVPKPEVKEEKSKPEVTETKKPEQVKTDDRANVEEQPKPLEKTENSQTKIQEEKK